MFQRKLFVICIKYSDSDFLKYGQQCPLILNFYFLYVACLKKWKTHFQCFGLCCFIFKLFYFQVIASPCTSVFDETKWQEKWQDTLCSFYLSKSSLLDSLNKSIQWILILICLFGV